MEVITESLSSSSLTNESVAMALAVGVVIVIVFGFIIKSIIKTKIFMLKVVLGVILLAIAGIAFLLYT